MEIGDIGIFLNSNKRYVIVQKTENERYKTRCRCMICKMFEGWYVSSLSDCINHHVGYVQDDSNIYTKIRRDYK